MFRRIIQLPLFFLLGQNAFGQNVGIGTTTPTGPLSFSSNTGNKIVLWGNGSQAHIGIGVGSSDLQFYTQNEFTGIAFGYGRSAVFNEKVRITNGSVDAMQIRRRMHILSGNPANAGDGGGVWLYKPDNSSALGFMGTQNNENIGFFGGPANWGFTYNALNSRVGIGNNNPAARLDVGGTNAWNLIDGEGDVRIGNANYRLKIGVALDGGGVGATGIMQAGGIGSLSLGANNKYLMELNGAANYISLNGLTGGLRIAGNAGAAGQVLSSNGAGVMPQWKSVSELLADQTAVISGGNEFFLNDNNPKEGTPIQFTMPANSTLLIWAKISTFKACSIGPCHSGWQVQMFLDGNHIGFYSIQGTSFSALPLDEKSVGPQVVSATPGPHTFSFVITNKFGNPAATFAPRLIILPN